MSMRMGNVANGEMMFQQGIRQTPMMDGPTQGPFGGPPPGLVNIPPPGLARSHMNNRMANGHVHPSMQSLNAQQGEYILSTRNGGVMARAKRGALGGVRRYA